MKNKDNPDNFSRQHEAIIRKANNRKEQAEEMAEAMKASITNVYGKAFKNKDFKAAIKEELRNNGGQRSEIYKQLGKFFNEKTNGSFALDLDNIDTGLEKRYWEIDEE